MLQGTAVPHYLQALPSVLRSGRAMLCLSSLRLERVELVHGLGHVAINQ